jgi:molybdopterin converting factor small subunit
MIQIVFYARYRELMGQTNLKIEFIGSLKDLLNRDELVRIPPDAIITINHRVASRSETIVSGAQISFLPPVSGG